MNEQQQPTPINLMSTTESGHFSKMNLLLYFFSQGGEIALNVV